MGQCSGNGKEEITWISYRADRLVVSSCILICWPIGTSNHKPVACLLPFLRTLANVDA